MANYWKKPLTNRTPAAAYLDWTLLPVFFFKIFLTLKAEISAFPDRGPNFHLDKANGADHPVLPSSTRSHVSLSALRQRHQLALLPPPRFTLALPSVSFSSLRAAPLLTT